MVRGQKPQIVLTMPLLEGLDGVQKMSKSLNNYIGIDESPDDMFGKMMSISDELMWRYFELLSFRPITDIEQLKQAVAQGRNPRDVKFELAEEIIARFHDQAAATSAREAFIARFQKGAMPEDIAEQQINLAEDTMPLIQILKASGLTSSTSDAIRMIKQGAVKIDGEKVSDTRLDMAKDTTHIYQVGKRKFAKITLS